MPTWSNYLAMGEHTVFIWAAYAAALVILGVSWIASQRRLKRLQALLKEISKDGML